MTTRPSEECSTGSATSPGGQPGDVAPVLLEARGLVVERGGRRVLDVPRFAVGAQETVAVVGPNGAGKSTLLLAMASLIRLTQGQLLVRGVPVTPRRGLRFRRRIGLVLADPLLLDTTVHRNVAAALRFRHVRGRDADARVDEWLDRLGVLALRDRHARELSSGEAQRVSLARALVLDPDVLLLDEPFASVDVAARAQLVEDTERLLAETARACIIVTHDLDEATRLGTRMGVVVNGRVRQDDTPGRVLATPVDAEVAAFVGAETRLPGVLVSVRDGLAVVDIGGRQIEAVTTLTAGRRVLCCLRPEDITLRTVQRFDPEPAMTSARNLLTGTLVKLTPKGHFVHVTVDCGATLVAAVTKQSTIEMGLRSGDRVEASFKATAVHVIGLPA